MRLLTLVRMRVRDARKQLAKQVRVLCWPTVPYSVMEVYCDTDLHSYVSQHNATINFSSYRSATWVNIKGGVSTRLHAL